MGNLSHVIYRSVAIKIFSDEELLEMLQAFRKKNASLDITGMLLYDQDIFFQVIEGEDAIISELYDSIKKDPRHRLVTTIVNEEIKDREFHDWSMGFYKVNQQQLNQMEGINDFFTSKRCLSEVNLGIAKKLLHVFAARQ